jgi:subtilisin family serine protease
MSRRLAAPLVAALLCALTLPQAVAAADPQRDTLSKDDHIRIARMEARGVRRVTVLIAARDGADAAVAAAVASVGGTVRVREQTIGYLRAVVPVDRVDALAAADGVQALAVDKRIPLPDPRPGAEPEGQVNPTPFPAPTNATPNVNPYMPIADTGAAQFRAAHPTWDGRGVTVGILDTGVALDHPALATTTTGQPKIVDWVTFTHPLDDDDPTWIEMTTQVTGPTFTVDGVTYTAPSAGSFRFGLFDERDSRLGGELGNDVNRDGNGAGTSGLFGVLWDGGSRVWVDADQDLSFADQAGMRRFRTNRDVGTFGTDNPATAVKESMPFVVQVDAANQAVNIGIVSAAHGTHVAGIVAGNGLFGGPMSGAAPGAQIVSVRVCLFISGCTEHGLVEGMIYAVRKAEVDVINMSIGGLPALNDGNNATAILYNRLIDRNRVQMFFSAGNSGPGENTAGDPAVATQVMSVGTYISDATWASNYGSTAPTPGVDNQHPFSSRGPREDGGFKPNIIAPGAAISTTPQWQPGGPVAGVHDLPPGYSMFNGTSMASPQAAGAAALLVSAAQQQGVQHLPAQLRQAFNSTSRFIGGYGAYEQGNGLIDVAAAWDVLRLQPKTATITSSVEVNTVLSDFLATPDRGPGIHDREGVTMGQAYDRVVTFRRTEGPGGNRTFQLSWTGNDGTFSSPSSIVLRKNVPANVTVHVNPSAFGAHSAVLNVDDPSTPGIDYQTLNTVIVPYEFDAANGFSHTFSGSVGRNQSLSWFFRVPEGTPAFKVDFSGPSATPGTGQARFLRWHPFGVGVDSNASTNCYVPAVAGCSTGSPTSRTATDPAAGVWELTVDGRRTADAEQTPFTLTATILGASISPDPDVIPAATIGTPIARSYTSTNLFGPFTGRAVGTTLGSARLDSPSIANGAQQQFPVDVTAGSTSLRATIGNPSDAAADLDLFVFDCTTGTCNLAGQSADGDSEESVTIQNPAAGQWVVLVDGFAVPAGTTTYDYVDVFANSAFGSIGVTDANAIRPAGASWTVPATVTANAAPAAGRVLLGNVEIRTDTNVLIGRSDVIVQSVS